MRVPFHFWEQREASLWRKYVVSGHVKLSSNMRMYWLAGESVKKINEVAPVCTTVQTWTRCIYCRSPKALTAMTASFSFSRLDVAGWRSSLQGSSVHAFMLITRADWGIFCYRPVSCITWQMFASYNQIILGAITALSHNVYVKHYERCIHLSTSRTLLPSKLLTHLFFHIIHL